MREAREYWLTGDMFDRVLEAHSNKENAYKKYTDIEKIHVHEVLEPSSEEITDTMRLDWMIERSERIMHFKSGYRLICQTEERFNTPREAIDAAMKECEK